MQVGSTKTYNFDRVFDETVSTQAIFEEKLRHMVTRALRGQNMTVMAYGQTASGKTYTMHGSNQGQTRGLVQHVILDLFDKATTIEAQQHSADSQGNQHTKSVRMWVSFFEVYNEQVNDLLTPHKKNLELRGD